MHSIHKNGLNLTDNMDLMKIKLGFAFFALLISNLITAQTASVTEGCSPLPVTFTPPAGTSAPYFWDFGNGASSPNANPTNPYNKPGVYTVVLKQGVGGIVLGNSIVITVSSKPEIVLTASPSPKGCAPLNVSLQATASPPPGVTIDTYSWSFGDGTGGTTGNPKSHTYSSAGVFDVTISINTSSVTCDTTRIFPKFISASTKPIAAFTTTPNPAISCSAPLTVSFTNTSVSSLPFTSVWTGPASTATNLPNQTYSVDGSFPVGLTVTDTNGCSSSSLVKTVAVGKPTASFSIPDTVCINTPLLSFVDVKNSSSLGASGNYLWTLDAGSNFVPSSNSSSFQPSMVFTTGGSHSVKLRATSPNGLCSHDTTFSIFVEDPTVTITSVPSYSCSEPVDVQFNATTTFNVVDWEWRFENLESPYFDLENSGPNPIHTFIVPDSMYSPRGGIIFTNTLKITTATGCVTTESINDTIHLVWARFMPDTVQGCAPLTVIFSDSSKSNTPTEPIVNWAWDYGDGTPVVNRPTSAPHPHIFASEGEYDVVLIATNNKGCNDTSYATTIFVGDTKAIDFSADKLSVCLGEPVTFTHTTTDTAGVDGWNFSSDGGEFLSHCFGDENPTVVFDDSTGLQNITMTVDYNGCLTQITKANYIDVKGPIAHFDYLITCGASAYDVQFTDLSGDATSLSWDFGDGSAPVATTGTFTHSYLSSDDYSVVLTATNGGSGCPPSKDTAIVYVKKIEARFSSDTTVCIGVPYSFDASASIDVYENCLRGYTWIFSEPTKRPITSSSSTSSISLDSAGNQTVGLIVQDRNGCVDTAFQTIKVYSTPVLYSISDDIICIPDTIQFTDLSIADTTIVKWEWGFGEGGIDSVQNPIYIYDSLPNATASVTTSLMITDIIGCESSLTKTISIYKLSSTISAAASPNICLGDAITFSATDFTSQGSNLTYVWDFGEGPIVTGNNNSYTYLNSQAYSVKLIYTEAATGCVDSTTQAISVQDYPLAAFSTNPDNSGIFCSPEFVTFTDTSTISAYSSPITSTWDFGSLGTGTGNTTSQTYISSGTYDVRLISKTSNGCADTITKSYLVVAPKGDFDMLDPLSGGPATAICKGDSIRFVLKDTVDVVDFTWFFGDGDTSIIDPATHTYYFLPPSGSTLASLIVEGQGGCLYPVEKPVDIHYVHADFTRNSSADTDSSLCLGESLLLTNTSTNADSYSWTLGDGDVSTTSSTINKIYDPIGKYSIRLAVQSTSLGCRDTTTKVVFVNPIPQVTAFSDSVCRGDTASIGVTIIDSSYVYSWTPTTGFIDASSINPFLIGEITTQYFVEAKIDSTGCLNMDTADVFVVQPLVDADWDTTIVIGEFITLPIDNQNGLVEFEWTPTKDLSCLDCSNPEVQPLDDILYSAFMQDVLGCFSATQTFDITVRPETFVKLPTTFTPNGDGFNDIIYVKGWGIKDLKSFEIYNRWGELVFKSTELSHGWDGYYKGMLQNNEIYVYKVRALDFRDKEIFDEGHINLMR